MKGKRERARKRRRGVIVFIVLLSAVLFWVPLELYLSNNAPREENVTVRSSRLPLSFDGFRILHLSDLHEKTFGKGNETLLRMAEAARPDIIALTGDLIQSEAGLSYARELLPKLTAIAPVYYVTGNHEWAADGKTAYMGRDSLIHRLETAVNDSGAYWLDSSFRALERGGESIVLAGVCDLNGPRSEPGFGALFQDIRDVYGDGFTVLLNHRYDARYENSAAEYDIALSGHAHGGVIRLPFTDGLMGANREWLPKGTSGVIQKGGTQVAVSRGLGDTYAPRFLNRPQMLVVTLRRG